MIFTSFEFILFFLLVVGLRSRLTNFSAEKWFLLAASYVFYMSWSVPCVTLILFTSAVDYYVGKGLGRIDRHSWRTLLLTASVVLNLGLLAFFKYTNFLLDNLWWGLNLAGAQLPPVHYNILLPAGISFFTFQSMSYTIDVYRGVLKPCPNLRDFLLFVAFFPQLVAGPIVRAASFLPQLARRVRASVLDIETGLAFFALGAVKKAVLSDQIAGPVETIFAAPAQFDAVTLLQGVVGYALQIYCDFSGYTDMAIGCARMMGFRFMENFRMPYSSANITEFWRRWHISLSTWLRDYLYISLGGNRRGVRRTYVNLLATMLLGGLWHGASWNFIIWGGLHGAALAAHKWWQTRFGAGRRFHHPIPAFVFRAGAWALTLTVVLVGWIFFRAQSLASAATYLARIVAWDTTGTRMLSPQILGAFAGVAVVHLLVSKDRNWAEEIPHCAVPWRVLAYAGLAILLVCLAATDAAPFIYFQF
jgi:alginate O-acetyltransferase complex protein AlgI